MIEDEEGVRKFSLVFFFILCIFVLFWIFLVDLFCYYVTSCILYTHIYSRSSWMMQENFVSCIECLLLYGLKGRRASRGSFWSFIVDCAKKNAYEKTFQDDVAFTKSLYFEGDKFEIQRGR